MVGGVIAVGIVFQPPIPVADPGALNLPELLYVNPCPNILRLRSHYLRDLQIHHLKYGVFDCDQKYQ